MANWSNCQFNNYYFHKFISVINKGIKNSDYLEKYTNKTKRYELDPTSVKFKPNPVTQIIFVGMNLADLKLALYKLKESVGIFMGFIFLIIMYRCTVIVKKLVCS